MLDVKVSVVAPELAEAMNALAAALKGASIIPELPANPTAAPVGIPATGTPESAPFVPDTPAPAPTTPPPATQMAPVAPPPAAPVTAPPPAVPVAAAPTYTRDQIMTAGAALIDAGKINELMGLLNAFGVQAVTQLKQEQLGAFATELRKLGAQI